MNEKGIKYKVLENLDTGTYQNSRIINIGNLPITVRDLLIKAPLIAGLNVYLVGGTGEGKTELSHDLASYLGDSYCYAIGRPDFEPSELLKQVRLDKIKEAKTDRELVELTENVNKVLFYCDELNRCPPITQNYFFDFFDGKLVHNGKIIPLGKHQYHLGYATGNIGDGAYVGISDTDRALKDRMHMIVKLDYPDLETTELDNFEIFSAKKDPRASIPKDTSDYSEELIRLHNEFREREVPLILPLLGVYFTKGLDYLENTLKHSKRAVAEKWPRVEGIREDTDESKIFPLSKRAVFGAIALSQAIEILAEAKGKKVEDSVPIFLDCLRFTVPYSGVIAPNFVNIEHDGDAYAAFDAIIKRNREQISDKLSRLEEALLLAETGERDTNLLEEIAKETEGKWLPVRNAISMYADKRKENPSDKVLRLKDIIEQTKSKGK